MWIHCVTCNNELISKLWFLVRITVLPLCLQHVSTVDLSVFLKFSSPVAFDSLYFPRFLLFWVFFVALLLLSTFEMWVVSHGLPFRSILSLADKHPLLPYSRAHCFTYPSHLCRWYLDEVFWSWGSSQSVYSFKLMPPGYTYFNIWISYRKPNSCFLASSHLKV